MGIGRVFQRSIEDNSNVFWDKIGNRLPYPDTQILTTKYNKGFVNFCVLVGIIASVKLTVYGFKKLKKALHKNKALNKEQFLQRYGEQSWAVIADVANNQEYCKYLAKQGLNLILMGDASDIKIVSDMISLQNPSTKTISYPVDWSNRNFDFEQLAKDLKDYDLSFLVLPKQQQVKKQSSFGTHVQQLPYYERFYLLVRYLGPQLNWRSYQSAIILPSAKSVGQLKTGHGVRQGVITALDAFMRTLNFEMKDSIDVIAVRGSVEQCFKDLGKQSVSH